ncbi:hypothetical protein EV356DRAFT_540029 [Neofusicoccum parvum]|uniref:Uncharacterized protein n=1 Tax=Neofusicoccum parvum TaxID=310453 RepID=A0ACB5RZK2_9PEZI|nr:hypothetical protein EV356DRAFT_540029 [Neofusicoccum parvum]
MPPACPAPPSRGPTSLSTMFEPTLATLAAGTNVAIKLAEYGLQLREASAEVHVFSRLIKRVQADLDEALRLHSSPAVRARFEQGTDALRARKAWVDRAVRDAVEALAEIGRYVEGARIDEAKERSMRLDHRFQWIFDHRNKVVMQEKALSMCHASLLSAIKELHRIEEGAVMPGGGSREDGGAESKGAAGEEVGGGKVGEQAAQLPTYESSQYDERVVPSQTPNDPS